MRHGSLFSGIDGFSLAADWMEWQNIFQVEIDNYCHKLLNQNFPNVTKYKDIRDFNGTKYRGLIDILTGGFPCQGFSVAGKQRGKSDPRWLWPEMFRVIREIQPAWVIGENVPRIIKLALEDICVALESEGYEVQPFIIPSASIGAWDKRDRVWIIAYNSSFRCNNRRDNRKERHVQGNKRTSEKSKSKWERWERGIGETSSINVTSNAGLLRPEINEKQTMGSKQCIEVNPDIEISISEQSGKTWSGRDGLSNGIGNTISKGLQRYSGNDLSGRNKEQERQTGHANWLRNWIEIASELCRSNARVSNRMDRIKALGNSVNPYVAYEIFKAIEQLGYEQ